MTFSILSLPLTFHMVNAKKVWFSHGTEINSKIWNDSISVCYHLWSHFSGTTLAALMLWPDLCLSVSWGLIFIYVYKSLILKQTLFPLLTATYPFQDSRCNWKKENPEELRKTSWKTWGAAEHNHSDVPSSCLHPPALTGVGMGIGMALLTIFKAAHGNRGRGNREVWFLALEV